MPSEIKKNMRKLLITDEVISNLTSWKQYAFISKDLADGLLSLKLFKQKKGTY